MMGPHVLVLPHTVYLLLFLNMFITVFQTFFQTRPNSIATDNTLTCNYF